MRASPSILLIGLLSASGRAGPELFFPIPKTYRLIPRLWFVDCADEKQHNTTTLSAAVAGIGGMLQKIPVAMFLVPTLCVVFRRRASGLIRPNR